MSNLNLFPDENERPKGRKPFIREELSYYVTSREAPDRILITGIPKGTQVMNQFAMKKRLPNNKVGWFIYFIEDAEIYEKRGRAFLAKDVPPSKIFLYDFGEWVALETLYP